MRRGRLRKSFFEARTTAKKAARRARAAAKVAVPVVGLSILSTVAPALCHDGSICQTYIPQQTQFVNEAPVGWHSALDPMYSTQSPYLMPCSTLTSSMGDDATQGETIIPECCSVHTGQYSGMPLQYNVPRSMVPVPTPENFWLSSVVTERLNACPYYEYMMSYLNRGRQPLARGAVSVLVPVAKCHLFSVLNAAKACKAQNLCFWYDGDSKKHFKVAVVFRSKVIPDTFQQKLHSLGITSKGLRHDHLMEHEVSNLILGHSRTSFFEIVVPYRPGLDERTVAEHIGGSVAVLRGVPGHGIFKGMLVDGRRPLRDDCKDTRDFVVRFDNIGKAAEALFYERVEGLNARANFIAYPPTEESRTVIVEIPNDRINKPFATYLLQVFGVVEKIEMTSWGRDSASRRLVVRYSNESGAEKARKVLAKLMSLKDGKNVKWRTYKVSPRLEDFQSLYKGTHAPKASKPQMQMAVSRAATLRTVTEDANEGEVQCKYSGNMTGGLTPKSFYHTYWDETE